MKYSPEVLIYLQTVKKFFENNDKAQEYFFVHYNEKEFFEKLADISQNNFDTNGEVMLDINQFESLRSEPISSSNHLEFDDEDDEIFFVNVNDNIFMEIDGYEKICLN